MKIVIAGGTGQVGQILTRAFERDGHQVVLLSRRPGNGTTCTAVWDARSHGPWMLELEGADAVINLAGRSVNCRYGPKNRREITESRVDSTRVIGEAIALASRPPRVWLQASTATIYAHRYDAANDEITGCLGGDEPGVPETWRFSISVAKAWEAAARAALPLPRTRQVLLRSAIVMSPDRGGVFDALLRHMRLGFGAPDGDGRQFVSWIHEHDFIRAVYWLIDHDELDGAVNLASPHPLPEHQFMDEMRAACGKKFGVPTPAWLLEIGAFLIRTETELLLKSRRVVPTRLLESGFRFEFPDWCEAARDLCSRRSLRP